MTKKYFTPEEANTILPAVKAELEYLQAIKLQFEEKYRELTQLRGEHTDVGLDDDPFFTLECEIEFLQIEAKGYIQSIQNKGAEIKNIEQGLVDFPAQMNGEEVLLCWKQGEASITHYHGLNDGYAGRKPIDE